MIDAVDIIRRKRDGGELGAEELAAFIRGCMSGEIPDYQLTAWLMAVFFRGLSLDETLALTDALVASGERLDLSGLGFPVVDKHSSGGVGDKVTLVLGPAVAACGVAFGKLSGCGLGHTGGTVDKLESIPGFRMMLSSGEFVSQLKRIGLCVAGQSRDLVPADRKLYGLRDLTATVESNSLVAASIMSKKIAGGAAGVVLDIKVGRGAFFQNRGQASGAAHLMEEIGKARGVRTEALLTSMEQPLGFAVGNALEVLEAAETLKGRGPADLVDVVAALGARLLLIAGASEAEAEAETRVRRSLADGSALKKFREWITAQGGDPAFIDEPARLKTAGPEAPAKAGASGNIAAIDALEVGRAVQELGAGRHCHGDRIDHGVGAVLKAKVGDSVGRGGTLATIHARSVQEAETAAARIAAAYKITGDPVPAPSPLFRGHNTK